jgi:hypothetical protein
MKTMKTVNVEVWLHEPLAHYNILELAHRSTLQDLFWQLGIQQEEVRFTFVNGESAMLPGSQINGATTLHERDQVDIYKKYPRSSSDDLLSRGTPVILY